jgi:hypothetical protein
MRSVPVAELLPISWRSSPKFRKLSFPEKSISEAMNSAVEKSRSRAAGHGRLG